MNERKEILIACTMSMGEPAVRNRLEQFLNVLFTYGYRITLVCAVSDLNKSVIREDVTLIEIRTLQTKIKNFIKRAMFEIVDSWKILRVVRKQNKEINLLIIPSMFLGLCAPFLLKKEGTFLDICDLSWEYLSDKGFIYRQVRSILRLWFRVVANRFEGIIVTNEAERKYVKSYFHSGNLQIVPNGVTQDQFDKLNSVSVNEHKGRTIVTYAGNIGLAQHLDTLMEAAVRLPDIEFNIIGDGTDFERISKLSEDLNIKNMNLFGRLSWDEVKDVYSCSDILYAQLTREYSTAVPSKLYEYLSTGKYVIYGGMEQAAKMLALFKYNKVIRPCDTEELVMAINEYADNEKRGVLCYDNRELIRCNFIREQTALRFINMIREV